MIRKLRLSKLKTCRGLGQNHLLTNFVKTNFPNLSILLAYIKTKFANTHSAGIYSTLGG